MKSDVMLVLYSLSTLFLTFTAAYYLAALTY